jgi:exonuclease III
MSAHTLQAPRRADHTPAQNNTPDQPLLYRSPIDPATHPLIPVQTLWQELQRILPSTQATPHHIIVPPAPPPQESLLRQAQSQWINLFQRRRAQQPLVPDGNRPMIMTHNNTRTNDPWGDLLQEKPTHHTRIYAMNVNGLRLDRRGGQFDNVCEIQKEVQADMLCGQEHNLDSNQTHVRSILYSTCRHHWRRSRIIFGTTPILFANPYKPGGTFIVSAGDITGRIRHQETDKWGRWVSQTLQGREGLLITVISAYQVVSKEITPGSITSASQQQSLLMSANDTTANPRTAFRRDLTHYISQCKDKGHEILLLGDFNEPFGNDPDGMPKLAAKFHLIDLMTSRHSSSSPATYARGRTRLDYALATPHVANSLKRAGYEAFNARFHTDHRAYFLDFDTGLLLGTQTQSLGSTESRILRTSNVAQVTQYIKTKYDLLLEHNVFERIERLTHPGDRHAFAERLDKDILAASLAAEQRMKPYGSPSWSIELVTARRRVSFLSKYITMRKTGLDHEEHIRRYQASQMFFAPDDNPIPITLQECTTQLRESKKEVDRIVKDSYARRDAERTQKIKELETSVLTSDQVSAQRLRRLRKAEDLKQLFSKLRCIRNQGKHKGITRIEIPVAQGADPKTCVQWKQIEVPTEILHLLQQRNREHFGQAHGTPFTIPPLYDELGFCGDGPASMSMLDGSYDASQLESNVALLIQHLKQTDEMAAIETHPTITADEYISKLKIWTESTSTSPSGLHLGHYKALISRHQYSDIDPDDAELTDKRDEWNQMQTKLLDVHVLMLNYALERGYAYQRWKTVTNTIIFKDTDNTRIHRTRVIHIYEADYNLMLGIKWRIALYQAEALRELNAGQYGSRPRRNALDPVLMEELQFEISRASRKTFAQTNYDATSCYDRIIPNLAMMVSKKFGVPHPITVSNSMTLQNAEYHIRTEQGVASTGYKHNAARPIYGTGQGSGNSPMIWCFLSSLLFDCYATQSLNATYCRPNNTEPISIGMIGFVDDSNGQTNCFQEDETEATNPTMVQKLRSNAQVWANMLGVSGGSLELSKCSYHLVEWKFALHGDPVLISNTNGSTQPIAVKDPITHEVHTLTSLSPYTAHKTLGHYKEPAGSQHTQFQKLRQKSDESTAFLWKCQLTPLETWTYYFACYLPSVGYPLPCSSMTFAQLDRVQRKAMQIIFAKCGYNRHTKREILFGPLEFGGASFRHLYLQQGVGQVTMFLRHWRSNSDTGKLLRCALALTHMTAGISQSILIEVQQSLPHLESKWLASLRTFLATIEATIEVDDPGIPSLQRNHDSYLMDHILQCKQFTNAQIRRLNYCRLYLQAVTISDVTTTSGLHLDSSKQKGEISLYSSVTQCVRVNQDRPSDASWKLWRRANLLWSDSDGKLILPLGSWLFDNPTQRQRHFAYSFGTRIALRIGAQYQIHKRRQKKYYFTGVEVSFADLPTTAHPTEVLYHPATDSWAVHKPHSGPYIPPQVPPISATFEEYIQTLQPWEIDLLRHVRMSVDPYSVCEGLEHGFCAVSDGSVRYQTQGSFGWVLSASNGERVVTCMGPARGPRPSSYRAEGYGLLSFLLFLRHVAAFTSKHEPWLGTIGTDSKSLLQTLKGHDRSQPTPQYEFPLRINGDSVTLDALSPDWDVLIEIQHALHNLPDIKLQFIKGHQDRKVRFERLSLMAQLNVEADDMATMYQTTYGGDRPFVPMTTRTRAHLVTSRGTITSRYPEAIRNAYTGPALKLHIQNRNKWTDTTLHSINWLTHGNALRNHISQRLHFSKMVHDILPTASQLNKMDRGKRCCPCCFHPHEDRDHIIRCPHPTRNKWRHALLTAIYDSCIPQHTYAPLLALLIDALRAWMSHNNTDPEFTVSHRHYPQALHLLIQQQNHIGWRQLFHGRFSGEWSRLQGDHYYRIQDERPGNNHKYTGDGWQVKLITLLWKHWRSLWKQRNQDVFGHDAATVALAEKKEVRRRLDQIYDQRYYMEPSTQALLCKDIQQHLQQPTWVIKNWLTINSPVIQASIKHARTHATRGVRSIRTYFGAG